MVKYRNYKFGKLYIKYMYIYISIYINQQIIVFINIIFLTIFSIFFKYSYILYENYIYKY